MTIEPPRSRLSTSTTYPSSLSSVQDHSALGIYQPKDNGQESHTSAPLPSPRLTPTSPSPKESRQPSHLAPPQLERRHRSRTNLRTAQSISSLRAIPETAGAPQPSSADAHHRYHTRSSVEQLKPTHKSSRSSSGLKMSGPERPSSIDPATYGHHRHSSHQRPISQRRSLSSLVENDILVQERPVTSTRRPIQSVSAPLKPSANAYFTRGATPTKDTRKSSSTHNSRPVSSRSRHEVAPPPSPAKTEDTMAEDWEVQLVRNAEKLRLSGYPSASTSKKELKAKASGRDLARERDQQRRKDAEWEKSGIWESQRDTAREAEDRVRRDSGREIGESSERSVTDAHSNRSIPTIPSSGGHTSRADRCHFNPYRSPSASTSKPGFSFNAYQPARPQRVSASFLPSPGIADIQSS